MIQPNEIYIGALLNKVIREEPGTETIKHLNSEHYTNPEVKNIICALKSESFSLESLTRQYGKKTLLKAIELSDYDDLKKFSNNIE